MAVDCTSVICMPIELFLGFVAISVGIAIFGFIRQPQIPAMLAFGGLFILFISVMVGGLIMGSIPDSSTTAGATTTYDMTDNNYDFRGFPQVVFALMGAIMMLSSVGMVVKT